MQRLRGLLSAQVRVVRDDVPLDVDVTELVRSDLVLLGAGDRFGADMLVEVSQELRIDESMVTGREPQCGP